MAIPFDRAVESIIAVGQRLYRRGLADATSGNYSARVDEDCMAITVSGCHKGRLGPADVMPVHLDGRALDGRKPSAETPLHAALYRLYPQANAVLHAHSTTAVTLTKAYPNISHWPLQDYEMLKAFPNVATHETCIEIPVFDNDQDTQALARRVTAALGARSAPPAYLIRAHGINAWGENVEIAERVMEALEHLLKCELQVRQLMSRGNHEPIDRLS